MVCVFHNASTVTRLIVGLIGLGVTGVYPVAAQPPADPLEPILRPVVKPTVEAALRTYRHDRRYRDEDFPLSPERFKAFRNDIIQQLTTSARLDAWVVRNPAGKVNPLAGRYRDRLLKTIAHHGIRMEVHLIEIPEIGIGVPAVVCLPKGDDPRPGICVFSGHSRHGLRDLVVDLNSYQRGLATRLAQAGLVTVAVEKIDSGYLSRTFPAGVDEKDLATHQLSWGWVTRSGQLMACLAASEILAGHRRVDETRIGAAGVSLGGWLSAQTALLTDRITAVADFGVKTLHVPTDVTAETFRGPLDLCHVLPGMLSVSDRNLIPMAYCPRPMLAGHGRKDLRSSIEGPVHYKKIFEQQYQALGHPENYEYHIHDGGDIMPDGVVTDYFRRIFHTQVAPGGARAVDHLQGEMVGEVTQTSAILQSRLTADKTAIDGDVPGRQGIARFELATDPSFSNARHTSWIEARPESDFIVKERVTHLRPGTRYHYRLEFGPDRSATKTGPTRTFKTLSGETGTELVRFVVVTGMMFDFFHFGRDGKGARAYRGDDRHLGFPALDAIADLQPDFFVGTGDNVYYDPGDLRSRRAGTQAAMRKKWHEQFAQPRFVKLFSRVPTYWEKDDHDYRYNDCDPSGEHEPSSALGIKTFIEQVPVVAPDDPDPRTYRTHRVNKLLQIWLVEGRDYRSPNRMPDGPDKTLWGKRQNAWLRETLLASDADFKILISPTPMVGPDDGHKRDNHADLEGFRHEGEAFFGWLRRNGFLKKHFYIVCGDRHWQYHSVHPSGFEEFSSGALCDANARLGRKPGDPKSSDPDGNVRQRYTQSEPSGGFLEVTVTPGAPTKPPALTLTFRDETGHVLYRTAK